VTNFVQFQTTNICYNSVISSRTSLFIYAPQHWSGLPDRLLRPCVGLTGRPELAMLETENDDMWSCLKSFIFVWSRRNTVVRWHVDNSASEHRDGTW